MYKGLHVKRPLFCQILRTNLFGDRYLKKKIQEEDSLYQQSGLKFEEETSKMLHLEHGFVLC